MTPEQNRNEKGSCLGCLIVVAVIWILVTGVVIDGTHYRMGCDGAAPEIKRK